MISQVHNERLTLMLAGDEQYAARPWHTVASRLGTAARGCHWQLQVSRPEADAPALPPERPTHDKVTARDLYWDCPNDCHNDQGLG